MRLERILEDGGQEAGGVAEPDDLGLGAEGSDALHEVVHGHVAGGACEDAVAPEDFLQDQLDNRSGLACVRVRWVWVWAREGRAWVEKSGERRASVYREGEDAHLEQAYDSRAAGTKRKKERKRMRSHEPLLHGYMCGVCVEEKSAPVPGGPWMSEKS